MSVVNVFIGQCGNQVGTDFLRSLAISSGFHRHNNSSSPSSWEEQEESSTFFRSAATHNNKNTSASSSSNLPRARAVCIDMEPKVIQNCDETAQRSGLFSLPPLGAKGRVTRHSGSGNNWACGYCVHGKQASDEIVDALRLEAEKADIFAGFHVVHSVAGGTGSGVGSLTSDLIRDNFASGASMIPLTHTVVWPYEHGELSPQWINCALTLSVLDETADAVHVISNDVATSHLKSAPVFVNRSKVKVSIPWNCVNSWMAREMAALWLPTSRKVPLFDLVSSITNLGSDDDDDDDHQVENNKSLQKESSSSFFSTWSHNNNVYLPPLTYSEKIFSLCPSKKRSFFESCGSVSVFDDPQSSAELLSIIHSNTASTSQNMSPLRSGARSTTAYFTKSELISMLHGNSASSYPEALVRSYRLLQKQEKEDEHEDADNEERTGGDDNADRTKKSFVGRTSELILCHGATAEKCWTATNRQDAQNRNLQRMLEMVVSQKIRHTTIGISGCEQNDEEHDDENRSCCRSGVAFAPLATTKFSDQQQQVVDGEQDNADDFNLYSSSTLSVYSNNSSFGGRVYRAMRKAETLLETGAFVHHFTNKGLEEDDLKEAVIQCYDIASRYGVEI